MLEDYHKLKESEQKEFDEFSEILSNVIVNVSKQKVDEIQSWIDKHNIIEMLVEMVESENYITRENGVWSLYNISCEGQYSQ